jgi:hypothetical protein
MGICFCCDKEEEFNYYNINEYDEDSLVEVDIIGERNEDLIERKSRNINNSKIYFFSKIYNSRIPLLGVKTFSKSKKEDKQQRDKILFEFYTTERDYVINLQVLRKRYIKESKKLLEEDTFSLIFTDIEVVYGINKILLKQLQKILDENDISSKGKF